MKKAFIRPGEKKRAEITGRKANPVVYVLVLKLSVVIRFAEAVEGEEEEEAMMTMERRKRFSVNVAEMKNVEDNRDHDQKKQKKLDLSGLSLDIFPTSTLNLSAVTVLDLSNNNLKVIPESLTARLLNLVVMDVHSNQLETLPNSLGCLSKLKVLNVSGNLLHTLPKTIEDCKSLEELVANFNKLTMLPETMGFELTNLQKLLVNSNKLDFLPFSTSHMTMLRLLDARLNCLQSLPEGLENLIRLEVLNVSQNFQHLRSIPPSVGLLLSLTELDISYNCISTLPESLGCLMKLQKFHVEGNPLVCPPMEVFEHGLDAVRSYLGDRMNGAHESRPKKSSWIGKFVKCATFSEGMMPNAAAIRAERDEFLLSDYRSIDGHASPRFMSMFSPRRLFSPRRSKSGHQTN